MFSLAVVALSLALFVTNPTWHEGHEGRVWSAAFSPDGAKVVTASDDSTARLWDAASADLLWTSPIPFWDDTWDWDDLVVRLLLVVLFVFVPTLKIFDPGRLLYLRKPNPYLELFDMPGIEQWLPPGFLDQRKRQGWCNRRAPLAQPQVVVTG